MTRPLGKERTIAYDKIFPQVEIAPELKDDTSPASLFSKNYKEHWLEIGFGGGEHLFALMQQRQDVAFIGAEPFINGIASLTQHLNQNPDQDLSNIRIFPDDALLLVEKLQSESLERIYLLNPDPWPKNRHAKRRILSNANLDQFHRVLKPGSLLLTCTDVAPLAEWMVTQLANHKGFTWTANNCNDWQNPPPGWASTTRYREKGAKAGRKMTYLVFKKLANC